MDLVVKDFLFSTITLSDNFSISYLSLIIGILAALMLILWIKSKLNQPDEPQKKIETHLDLVSRCTYRTQKIMNSAEYAIFNKLKKILDDEFYVFPQVALGEALASDEGHCAINAKRVDFLIVDSSGHAVAAVEFKGAGKHGHYQGDAVERDTVKFMALNKAGVKYIALSTIDELYIRRELENANLPIKNNIYT